MLDEPEPASDDDDDTAHESIMELPGAEESSSEEDEGLSEEGEDDGNDDELASAELNSVDGEDSDSEAEEARLSNAWGKKRDQFYDTDYVDGDYRLEDEELEMAEEEEKEALLLQSRRLAGRDDADFVRGVVTWRRWLDVNVGRFRRCLSPYCDCIQVGTWCPECPRFLLSC